MSLDCRPNRQPSQCPTKLFLMKYRLLDSFVALQDTIRGKRSSFNTKTSGSIKEIPETTAVLTTEIGDGEETEQSVNHSSESRLNQVEISLKSHSEPDFLEFTSPTDPILESFSTGKYSDIIIRFEKYEFHLHRVILCQSKYFQKMLRFPAKELKIGVINGTFGGLRLALQDLYDFNNHRQEITIDNAFHVLYWAMKLQLEDLGQFLVDMISKCLYKYVKFLK